MSGYLQLLQNITSENIILETTPIIVDPETRVIDAIALMNQSHTEILVVINHNKPVGLFTAKNLVKLLATTADINQVKVGEVITDLPLILKQSNLPNIATLISLFNDTNTNYFVVVSDSNQLIGLVSNSSILKSINLQLLYQSITTLQQQINTLTVENADLKDYNQQKLQEIEQEFKELKNRFITTVSHEFRTPLTTISFSAGLLESYSQRFSEKKKQTHFDRIKIGIQQMTELLNDILIIEKAESGKLILNPIVINLQEFCSELIEAIQLTTDKHNLILFCPRSSLNVILDENLIYQILTNLISNAIKYSPLGGNIEIYLNFKDEQVILKVKDLGIGIPDKDKKRLFEPFHRGSNVGSIPGTGLGLTMVKKAVDLQLGKILLDSEEGVETICTVILPSTLK